ncbi:MAG TPA: cobalamin-binding protein [Steroidobacteraceae bacterium]|nr:cobalamin-binding protein [Steroidobacteraceae bacterium]
MQRIVSFLPSATEMVCALGLGDRLMGITHECDYPPEVKGKPIVVHPVLPVERMSQSEIDVAVTQRLRDGLSLYQVNERLIRDIAPNLILTQDLCQVCAPSGDDVSQLLATLAIKPRILSMTPKSLDGIFSNLQELGEATGLSSCAQELVSAGRARLARIAARTRQISHRPRVFCMEWMDPLYCSGHWIPEMVELAGGTDELGHRGTDSVRIAWDDVLRSAPEVLVVMPCGFGLEKAATQLCVLFSRPGWFELPAVRAGRVYAVDANAFFARPGPRVVDGTELLAHLLHPTVFDWTGPANAFRRLTASQSLTTAGRAARTEA